MPEVESKVTNDADNLVYCRIEDTPQAGNNPDIDKALAAIGVALAALAILGVLPVAPAAVGGVFLSKGINLVLTTAKSAKLANTTACTGGVAAVWGATRTFAGSDTATVKTALLMPNGSLSNKVEKSTTIHIVRTGIELRNTIGGGEAPSLVSRLIILKKTTTDTTSVRNLATSDDDVMFSIELPQPAPNKSYFIYAASVFGFRNLVPPTAEEPATPGGIWEVVKDYFTTGSERTVEGWVHQMVDDSSTRQCQWTWGNSPIYLEKGYPLVPAGSAVTSRYEIVTFGNLCTRCQVIVGPLPRIEATLMQPAAGTNGKGGSDGKKKLFAIDNNSDTTYIKYGEGGIVYLPAVQEASMVYPKIIEISSWSSSSGGSAEFRSSPTSPLSNAPSFKEIG
ncbi:hypothetical protein B0H13DRAFT_1879202 [Mycena leptocephala]|nr:hypothetical protein B0H13DRAFT_1879202 [Mycena leptocephala]